MPKSKSKARVPAVPRRAKSAMSRDAVARFYMNQQDAFRYPDQATAATAIMRLPEDQPIATNVNGDAAVGFAPNLTNDFYSNTITSGNFAATWTALPHPSVATLTANTGRARMTGWRFTVTYTGPEQTTSGIMYVGSSLQFSTTMISSGMSGYTGQMQQYPMKSGAQWIFYAPMLGNPDFGVINTSWMHDFFSGMVFLFRGLPASVSCISIRSERSIEYVPDITSSILVTTMPEPYDPVGIAEAGVLSGTAQEVGTDSGTAWSSKVSDAIYDLVRGTGRVAVDIARDNVRQYMAERRVPMLEL